jgi:hypothetical protein
MVAKYANPYHKLQLKKLDFMKKFTQFKLTACQKMCDKVWLNMNFKQFAVQSLK